MIEWMNEWMNDRMNELINEWSNKWINECMNAWMNEWMNERNTYIYIGKPDKNRHTDNGVTIKAGKGRYEISVFLYFCTFTYYYIYGYVRYIHT